MAAQIPIPGASRVSDEVPAPNAAAAAAVPAAAAAPQVLPVLSKKPAAAAAAAAAAAPAPPIPDEPIPLRLPDGPSSVTIEFPQGVVSKEQFDSIKGNAEILLGKDLTLDIVKAFNNARRRPLSHKLKTTSRLETLRYILSDRQGEDKYLPSFYRKAPFEIAPILKDTDVGKEIKMKLDELQTSYALKSTVLLCDAISQADEAYSHQLEFGRIWREALKAVDLVELEAAASPEEQIRNALGPQSLPRGHPLAGVAKRIVSGLHALSFLLRAEHVELIQQKIAAQRHKIAKERKAKEDRARLDIEAAGNKVASVAQISAQAAAAAAQEANRPLESKIDRLECMMLQFVNLLEANGITVPPAAAAAAAANNTPQRSPANSSGAKPGAKRAAARKPAAGTTVPPSKPAAAPPAKPTAKPTAKPSAKPAAATRPAAAANTLNSPLATRGQRKRDGRPAPPRALSFDEPDTAKNNGRGRQQRNDRNQRSDNQGNSSGNVFSLLADHDLTDPDLESDPDEDDPDGRWEKPTRKRRVGWRGGSRRGASQR